MMRAFVLLAGFLVTLGAAACDQSLLDPSSTSLEDAPSRVTIAGSEFRLEAYLWRDFMPLSPPSGKPLIAVLRILTTDGAHIPEGIKADQVAIIHQGEVWSAPVKQEQPGTEPGVLEVVARDGPMWSPGVKVDVVVRLRDSGSRIYWLRAADQTIHSTS
jgi:hypothetical protein